jgi:dipeptidyl aminopeptidase/acylaminoacyl peptidase
LLTSTPDGTRNSPISRAQEDVREFIWAPNSERVAYTANDIGRNKIDLYSGSKSGSGSSILHSTGITTGQQVSTFKWAPDSSRIAFKSDRDSLFFRLFSVQPVNSFVFAITPGLDSLSDVIDFKWQAKILINSELLLAYRVDAREFELFTTPPNSALSTRIKPRLATRGDVFEFQWATDNSRIAYSADFDEQDVIELFSSLPNSEETFKVSGELVSGGDVEIFKWAPDSTGVGYIADQDFNNVNELFASQPKGENNSLLSGELVVGGDVTRFEWVP